MMIQTFVNSLWLLWCSCLQRTLQERTREWQKEKNRVDNYDPDAVSDEDEDEDENGDYCPHCRKHHGHADDSFEISDRDMPVLKKLFELFVRGDRRVVVLSHRSPLSFFL
jgi:hypothetical protein